MATQLASHCSLCRLLLHLTDRIYKAEKQNSAGNKNLATGQCVSKASEEEEEEQKLAANYLIRKQAAYSSFLLLVADNFVAAYAHSG
ncbi:unnamed protein product [Sphagnum jensenii]|jgi:hypothetical protein|uniref:Uncharacterized protein n=1 Tax=Sphagnum jensenii TaxID=128206 RepID=A0ABP0XJ88_9BRYO